MCNCGLKETCFVDRKERTWEFSKKRMKMRHKVGIYLTRIRCTCSSKNDLHEFTRIRGRGTDPIFLCVGFKKISDDLIRTSEHDIGLR